ncbi:hypothetical protein [Janthinobacterium sp. SUN206]|uniref:hypothetical protein n=1 Tax=Janthinobacterium sp. SUN206 TaxID=3014787 RepID=UPI0027128398|nr:hypothetical protein [Janthinobacterium sp. SUN206]MDO8069432.1 hypothetical protein [Janthinobacterium sp. SUN206]
MNKLILVFLVLFCVFEPAIAQKNGDSVLECRTIKDSGKRMQCYDKISVLEIKEKKKTESVVAHWEKEPNSFLSVKLGEKIELSILNICPNYPTYDNSFFAIDTIKWENSGKPLCYFFYSNDNHTWAKFYGYGVEAFRDGKIIFNDSKIVEKISVKFFSYDYAGVYDLLVKRYGIPSVTKKSEIRLVSGASLPNETSMWMGEKVNILLESFAERQIDGKIRDYGQVIVATQEYMKKNESKSNENIKEMADKL